MSIETVRVGLGARSYDILIGPGLLAQAGARIAALAPGARLAIITEERVWAAQGARLGLDAPRLTLPPGEATKSLAQYGRCLDFILDQGLGRSDLVVAFGGGVIGDLAGFAAASAKRGMDFVQIPTTLLAQVDSSVGGKTGINAPAGKNLIGAFHQPRLVLADTEALDTLSPRDFLSGYAETAKYGLLGDAAFFAWLEANGPGLRDGDARARIHAIRRACAMKAAIVARDERESGERALLNLGHTFGHALEAATGYSDRLLHGEGVSLGMVLAFRLSARLGLCAQETPSRVAAHLDAMGLPTRLAQIPGDLPGADALMALMAQDKKAQGGRIAFVLARGIGAAFLSREIDPAAARALLAEALAEG